MYLISWNKEAQNNIVGKGTVVKKKQNQGYIIYETNLNFGSVPACWSQSDSTMTLIRTLIIYNSVGYTFLPKRKKQSRLHL